MSIYLILFLVYHMFYCSVKIFPISPLYKGNFLSTYNLYCSQTTERANNIFFSLGGENQHLIYDQYNEELILSSKSKNNIKRLEYFDTLKEYLMIMDSVYYAIETEDETIQTNLGCDNFFILKNKDFIVIEHKYSLLQSGYYLILNYYSNPFNIKNKIEISLKDISIKHYEIIETSEAILFFLFLHKVSISGPLDLYALNKSTLEITKIKTLHDKISGFITINLDNNGDELIYCVSELLVSSNCFLAKYNNNDLIIEKTLKEVFSWDCLLPSELTQYFKNYCLINEQKIAIVCKDSSNIYLTLIEYRDNNIFLGDIVNKNIINFPVGSTEMSNMFLTHYSTKGIVIYFIRQSLSSYAHEVVKVYVDETCSSFEILTDLMTLTNISFYDYITGGINNEEPKFIITKIPEEIKLMHNNDWMQAGTTEFNHKDTFLFKVFNYFDTPLSIEFRTVNGIYSCNALIKIKQDEIVIKGISYKCTKSPDLLIINNIIEHDLNKSFDINVASRFYFSATFTNPVRNEDLLFRYQNIEFTCSKDFFDYNHITCILPTNFDLFPAYSVRYEYNIYSNLSCLNELYIGKITIKYP